MIDMHIHSLHSDGTDPAVILVEKASRLHLEVISITDHNSCLAYRELDQSDIVCLSHVKIITGCEFTTSFDGHMIEVLGYGFEHNTIQTFLDRYKNTPSNNSFIIRNLMEKKIQALGLKFDQTQIRDLKFPQERMESPYYEELRRYPQNEEIVDEAIWDTFGNFYRKGILNPQSRMYLHYADYYPLLSEINTVVHQNGGCTFLAHPFQYRLADTEMMLNNLFARSQLDGIECYHTMCTSRQTAELLNFANKHHLLISGGSDYHGQNKSGHDLGRGCGNLAISTAILEPWTVSFYRSHGSRYSKGVLI